MRLLHLEAERYSDNSLSILKQKFDVVILSCESQSALEKFLEQEKFEIIFTRLGLYISKEIIELQPSLKFIVTPTTGLNHIDTIAAEEKKVTIFSLKGEEIFLSSIKSTAEHTWALLLSLIRNIKPATTCVEQGKWDRNPFLCDELDGKTLGIIGYGRLGKIVAGFAKAFNMKVLVNDVNPIQYEHNPTTIIPSDLDNLLKESDYVILMIAYSLENQNFINKEKLEKVKKGAYFINTSRGELVNEVDLLEALQNGQLKGAALDVLNKDSEWDGKVQGSQQLIQYAKENSNLLITPHIGGYGINSILKTRDFVTQKLLQNI